MSHVPLTVPQMGVVEEVVVLEWLRENGSTVSQGEAVVVIESDKAEVELEAPATGRLEIAVPASDEEVAVLTVIAHVVSE